MKCEATKIHGEMERLSQRLASRIKELAGRYTEPLPALQNKVKNLQEKVNSHLKAMGFTV